MKHKVGIRECRVKRVTEYLQNKLLPLPYGGRLPGIRTIMEQTGTGRLTVSHALQELMRQGYILIRPDRGIFRIKPAEKSDEIRLLHWSLSSLDRPGFVVSLFRTLEKQAAEAGRKITVENVGQRPGEEVAEELIGHGISRCILCGAQSAEFARHLHRRMKICLEIFPRHSERIMPELRNSPEMTVIQVNYLLRLGYRRIGYIHYGGNDVFQYPVQFMRLMDYYRLMAENGLRVNPAWVFHCSDHYENLEAGLERMMASGPKPEALIVPGSALRHLYPYCRKHKIRIGKDLALFSQDEISEKLTPEPTTVTNNPEEIAETFWRMFRAAERGEKVESAYTQLFIRTGQTVPSRLTAG
ncbi:MAG: LacI family DNA-binding transcriptional regulator [Lentisphaeria bacterium]|nr:LacI family DNA-binding transcriptional regulator [Lentisphaeria bacterium]